MFNGFLPLGSPRKLSAHDDIGSTASAGVEGVGQVVFERTTLYVSKWRVQCGWL